MLRISVSVMVACAIPPPDFVERRIILFARMTVRNVELPVLALRLPRDR